MLLFVWYSSSSLSAQVVFSEDFGTSDFPTSSNDYGRKQSDYMPASSFGYGTSYANTSNALAYKIDDNYYAVVAPGYIKAGINPSNSSTWWTPAYNETGTVTDHSGTQAGAAMIINAGTTLAPFYQRTVPIEEGSYYKASMWLYIVNTPVRIAIDIKDLSGNTLTTLTTPAMTDASYKGRWLEVPIYFKSNTGCASSMLRVVFRNDYSETNGNDYYIDDLSLTKISAFPTGSSGLTIPCPITPCNAGSTAPVVNNPLLTYSSPSTGANLSNAFNTTPVPPTGATLVWYNNANHVGTALTDAQVGNAPEATYYAFYYDAIHLCFSPASSPVKVQQLCVNSVNSTGFNASAGASTTFTLNPTDKGFQLDVYGIDNSLNIKINGTLLTTQEIDFQSNHTQRSARFADGTYYGQGGIPEIWNVAGNGTTPVLRFIIRNDGTVAMYGSKTNNGTLLPLQLINGNALNAYTWNTSSNNTIVIGQVVDGPTNIKGRGMGLKNVPCKCTDPANTATGGIPTKVGITNQTKLGGWPESVPNGFLALESQKSGFVITRVANTAAITDPKNGMMVYDISANCVKLYRLVDTLNNMGEWKCISKSCNQY